ncbi:phage tail protein [Vibrio vulnificus]
MANTTDKSILTAAGKALLAQLNAEEKPLIIDKMIFANVPNRPEYPQPDDVVPTDHVVHQEGVEQRGRLTADSVIYSTTLTSDVGTFEFNWTGAYCSEHGVLVTIDHHALTPKTADEPGVAGNTLVRSVVLEYKDIAEITNITVDASSWQYNATPRMKKMDEDVAQAIIDQNGKDWFIDDGFLVTPSGSAYSIKAGAGYVSGNRVAMEFDRSVQVPNKPSFIYIDAHREGTPTGEQVTLFDFVITADEKDDYIDSSTGKDVKHFVCKIAQVLGDGSVSDLRPEGGSAAKKWAAEYFGSENGIDKIGDSELWRKNQSLLGHALKKIRYGQSYKIAWYGDSNSVRDNAAVQQKFQSVLESINQAGSVEVINRANSGDSAEVAYGRWTTPHDADISIISFGTNDATEQYGAPYDDNIADHIKWMTALIRRELKWGKAVVVLGPIPLRFDKRWETRTFSSPCDPYPSVWRNDVTLMASAMYEVADRFGAPFIDSTEILAPYEDEIFANSNGASISDLTQFGDPVHLTTEALNIWGCGVASRFIGDSLIHPNKAVDGTAYATRPYIDPFAYKLKAGRVPSQRWKYDRTPIKAAFGVGDAFGRRAFELQDTEVLMYSFYCETDDLLVYPVIYVHSESLVEIHLDSGSRLAPPPLDEGLKGASDYGFNGEPMIVFDTRTDTQKIINTIPGELTETAFRLITAPLRISRKGWHTITIKAQSGFCWLSGLRFLSSVSALGTSLKDEFDKLQQLTEASYIDSGSIDDIDYSCEAWLSSKVTNLPSGEKGYVSVRMAKDKSFGRQDFIEYGPTYGKRLFRLKVEGVWRSWTLVN